VQGTSIVDHRKLASIKCNGGRVDGIGEFVRTKVSGQCSSPAKVTDLDFDAVGDMLEDTEDRTVKVG
jgi:hypothetical protein